MIGMRKHSSDLIKLAVTVLGLFLVFRQVELEQIWSILRQVRFSWLLVSVLLLLASLLVRAYRWRLLLRGLNVSLRYSRLAELYFVGNFFNSFLPSGFGGDLVRIMEVAKEVPTSLATGTVLLDRLSGLIMLFLMAALSSPLRPDSFPPNLLWIILAGAAIGVMGAVILLQGSLVRRIIRPLPGLLAKPAGRLMDAVQGCGWPAVVGALAVSLLFNLLLAGWWFSTGRALGQIVSFSYYLLVMPLLSIPLLIPSIAGLGPRELLAPLLFEAVGMSAETAVSLSVLVFAINRLAGLFGAPVYIYSSLRESRAKQLLDV